MIGMDDIRIGPSESFTPPEQRPDWLGEISARLAAGGVAVRLHEAAFRVVEEQASGSLDEVGGILLGEAVLWEGRLYVDVRAALPGSATQAGPEHVTFTADTWAALLRRKEEELPEARIVGWYHSHPRMGIFLSGLDLSLHRHFFPQPWHVALVIDGQGREAGFFAWAGAEIRPVLCAAAVPAGGSRSRLALRLGAHPFTYEALPEARGEAPPAAPGPRPAKAAWSRWLALPLSVLALALWLHHRRRGRNRGRRRRGSKPLSPPGDRR